jgi:hypothetical protein
MWGSCAKLVQHMVIHSSQLRSCNIFHSTLDHRVNEVYILYSTVGLEMASFCITILLMYLYEVQICLLGCTAMKTNLNFILTAMRTWNLTYLYEDFYTYLVCTCYTCISKVSFRNKIQKGRKLLKILVNLNWSKWNIFIHNSLFAVMRLG